MIRFFSFAGLAALVCGAFLTLGIGAAPKDLAPPSRDLSEYRTVDKLVTTRITRARPGPVSLPGYLGVNVKGDGKGLLAVTLVQTASPAARAGLKPGDLLVRVDDRVPRTSDELRELLQAKGPGTEVALSILREQMPIDVKVTLEATSRPMSAAAAPKRAYVGVQLDAAKEGDGALITEITPGSPAEGSGLKAGDVMVKMGSKAILNPDQFRDLLSEMKPGDKIALTVMRGGKDQVINLTLGSAESGGGGPRAAGTAEATPWLKDQFRLAVVIVDFPDFKHNEKITPANWEEALFSRKMYQKTATGQPAHGSLSDYFLEQSFGRFHISGKAFAPISAAKKRGEYYQGAGGSAAAKTALLTEALEKLTTQGGKDVLNGFDGLCFIYAGAAVQTSDRGSLYYPHRGSVSFQKKQWLYIICPEGGAAMESISVFAPVFGRLLGLPDLAARTENAGSTGLGVWCLMSNGAGKSGRPGHLSAWCKEQLGWLEPAVIDPSIKQKIILGPVAHSARECVKVLVRLDGSEYLLLENRIAAGFDADLPGQGLLIWRVTNGQPTLEEAHGVAGPAGPRVHLDSIPYPSKANNAFTPFTTPSSRSVTGGGLPVFLTNIRRLPDGRVTFFVGYDYY
jgi:M6 family metalloprotease-like protein